jgi:retron-type reverse transcriptase
MHSFLSQQTVSLTVNNFTLDDFEASQGTPQGSPYSPLLSAIFTSEILRRAEAWPDGDACFYMDNGAIYIGGVTYRSAIGKAMSYLESICLWLHKFGLHLDEDKTELMFFVP